MGYLIAVAVLIAWLFIAFMAGVFYERSGWNALIRAGRLPAPRVPVPVVQPSFVRH